MSRDRVESLLEVLTKRATREEKRNKEKWLRYLERIRLYAECRNCSHMKNNECEYGNEEYLDEFCEDWEER